MEIGRRWKQGQDKYVYIHTHLKILGIIHIHIRT